MHSGLTALSSNHYVLEIECNACYDILLLQRKMSLKAKSTHLFIPHDAAHAIHVH